MLVNPDEFGRAPTAKVLDPTHPAARTAQMQARFAFHARVEMKTRRLTIIDLAHQIDMKPARLGRMLRGTTPMRLADMTTIAAVLNLQMDLIVEGPNDAPPSLDWLARFPKLRGALALGLRRRRN